MNTLVSTKAEAKEKFHAAEAAMNQIKERFGDGAIMRLGEAKTTKVEAISSGCLSMDVALGVGGFPRGRIIEIYGPESSGKTTLAQHLVAEVQRQGGIAAFVDAEHALEVEAEGVEVVRLVVDHQDRKGREIRRRRHGR